MKSKIRKNSESNCTSVMRNITINCHKKDSRYGDHQFFILNKGLNSGKPLIDPCPNCFVINFANATDKDSFFWLAFSLWQVKFWHQHLIGSVIPFLRIGDFKKHFLTKGQMMIADHNQHLKNVEALKLLQQKEMQFRENLILINDIRRIILHRYIKKF